MQRGLAIIFLALTSFATAQTPDYKNANLPVEQRVGDLLKRMTLRRKK